MAPLAEGKSKDTISHNIAEMVRAGHPQAQAVAAALHVAGRARRAEGGLLHEPEAPKHPKLHVGPIHSGVAGRTDHLPIHVPNGSYVIPADVVSAHGEGNTIAGFRVMRRLFGGMPYSGQSAPYGQSGGPYGEPLPRAEGGPADEGVPIVAAGGEYVVSPQAVLNVGGGDLDTGHRVLDEFVKRSRANTVKTLEKLPGPQKD